MVGAARERHAQPLSARERYASAVMAGGFVVACGITLLIAPWRPDPDLFVMAMLVVLYAVVSRIDFEVAHGYATPEQLIFVPLLFLAPLPLVPVLVALGFALGRLPARIRRGERGHALSDLAGTWFTLGPVWVLAALAPSGDRKSTRLK